MNHYDQGEQAADRGLEIEEPKKCTICGNELEHHAISRFLTCFLHGNPDSADEFERNIFAREIAKKENAK